MTPEWQAQRFPPEGSNAAEGIRNQLGRPDLDLLTILVRESAQNSWDARLRDTTGPVRFAIDLGTIGPAHADAWRTLLQDQAAHDDMPPLRRSLQGPLIRTLTVSDRGTVGLGGPTRADENAPGEQGFVSFIRNVGERRDSPLGGGTYGFGKAVFYLLSKPGTVLVHTRCRTPEGHLQTRLIGSALRSSYHAPAPDGGKRRYTGRHWWGNPTSDTVVDPLVDHEAERVATRLGLAPFGADETGTTIVVVDPELDELTPSQAAEYIAETMAWQLWPKMLDRPDGTVPMRFSVTCDGEEVAVPDPRTTRPLNLFVDAYRKLGDSAGKDLVCGRPKQLLGRLGLVRRVAPVPQLSWAARRAMETVRIDGAPHHVCLMRPTELVVTYYAGRKPGAEHISYAGVFRACDEMDDVFALAEPPTHDAWNSQLLPVPKSTWVRTTFSRIRENIEGLLELGGSARGSSQVALGAASSRFSSLVGGAWGIGAATDYGGASGRAVAAPDEHEESASGPVPAGRKGTARRKANGTSHDDGPVSTGRGSGAPRPRVQYVGDAVYEEREGHAVLVQAFRLPAAVVQRVRVELAVALPGVGNREIDPPLGAREPQLVGWEDPQGNLHGSPTYVIEGGDDAVWRTVVLPAPDTITEITVKTQAVDPS